MVFPGAFNTTTGPMHWTLLQRARAVDHQLFVAAVSPARDLSATYHAYGHTSVVSPMYVPATPARAVCLTPSMVGSCQGRGLAGSGGRRGVFGARH